MSAMPTMSPEDKEREERFRLFALRDQFLEILAGYFYQVEGWTINVYYKWHRVVVGLANAKGKAVMSVEYEVDRDFDPMILALSTIHLFNLRILSGIIPCRFRIKMCDTLGIGEELVLDECRNSVSQHSDEETRESLKQGLKAFQANYTPIQERSSTPP